MGRLRRVVLALAAAALAAGLGKMTVLAESPGARIVLGAGATTVALAPPGGKPSRVRLADRLRALVPGQRMLLVFADLAAEHEPGTTWAVYVDLPAGTAPRSGEPGYVGDLNFFGARPPGGGAPRTLSFDVTPVLDRLAAVGRLSQPIAVTLVPQAPPEPGAEPSLGQIRLVEQ